MWDKESANKIRIQEIALRLGSDRRPINKTPLRLERSGETLFEIETDPKTGIRTYISAVSKPGTKGKIE